MNHGSYSGQIHMYTDTQMEIMMIPTEVIWFPLYRLIVKMGLINNMWGIILPYLVVPMLVFFFRQYLMGIPKDFLDAARVDGCTEYGIFFKIMIPLMKPSFAAMGLSGNAELE